MQNSQITSYKKISPKLGKNVLLCPGSFVIGNVEIGDDSNIWFNTVIRGDVHWIKIGKGTNIQDNSTVHVTSKTGPTEIGDFITIGHGAIIHACTIDSYSLIGMGSTILDGAIIPKHSFVAAGSLVTPGKTFPEGYMIKGSPAKAVRPLTKEELDFISRSAADYIATAKNYLCSG